MLASQPTTRPIHRVANELAYELLRDEWELLLTIGTGPTSLEQIRQRSGDDGEELGTRLDVLREYGLVEADHNGYSLVPAFHQRQEPMASCLRDLVIRRLELGRELPLASGVRTFIGEASQVLELIERAERDLLPAVYERASNPASNSSRRYAMFFAACSESLPTQETDGGVERLLDLLKQSAIERATPNTRESAKLWIADVRIDPEIVDAISDLFSEFLSTHAQPAGQGGAAGFAIIASDRTDALGGLG